mgnify:CR=1 FL=1
MGGKTAAVTGATGFLGRHLVRRLADGDPLATRGSAAEEWCGVARGAVRVSSVSLSGKQVTLTYAEPGTWFGDIALFDGLLCLARERHPVVQAGEFGADMQVHLVNDGPVTIPLRIN